MQTGNIQIVVEMPEEAYKLLKNEGVDWLGAEHILNAVANGTPLKRGHGDLIDRDDLLVDSYYTCDLSGNEINIVDVMTVEMADAIIEADKE